MIETPGNILQFKRPPYEEIIPFDPNIYKSSVQGAVLDCGVYPKNSERAVNEILTAMRDTAEAIIDRVTREQIQEKLPQKPIRPYDRDAETVVDYLLSDDGLGPWTRTRILTRELMRNLDASAFIDFNNHRRRGPLPEELQFPALAPAARAASEVASAEELRWARRILRRAERDAKAARDGLA